MLSILIPTYNYNVVPLVLELHKQADNIGIDYEILVQDDCSQLFIDENFNINTLSNCKFSVNIHNLGRGKNINSLAEKSKYEFILILESDSIPASEFYLKNYVEKLSKSTKVIFGGVNYPAHQPAKEKMLRWKYGKNRETKSLRHRLENNYDFVFTWNLLVSKEILIRNPFSEFVQQYGYEDLIFIKNLRVNAVTIEHIENPLIHINAEFSLDFIKKAEVAVQTMHNLIKSQNIEYEDTRLTSLYAIIQKLHLIKMQRIIFLKTKKLLLRNLMSQNPNLYIFDFYKLGYLCSLSHNKNV